MVCRPVNTDCFRVSQNHEKYHLESSAPCQAIVDMFGRIVRLVAFARRCERYPGTGISRRHSSSGAGTWRGRHRRAWESPAGSRRLSWEIPATAPQDFPDRQFPVGESRGTALPRLLASPYAIQYEASVAPPSCQIRRCQPCLGKFGCGSAVLGVGHWIPAA